MHGELSEGLGLELGLGRYVRSSPPMRLSLALPLLHFARQSAGLEPAAGGQDERRRARPAPQSDAEHPFPLKSQAGGGPMASISIA